MRTIFLTGHGDEIDIENQADESVVYLAKPLRIDNLVQLLHQITGK